MNNKKEDYDKEEKEKNQREKVIKSRKRAILLVLISIILCIITIIVIIKIEDKLGVNKEITIETLSKYGSRGEEVKQIQTKLKRWGYLAGNIDGIYGNQTVEAVKYFQRKNGLQVDGIAGKKTLESMGIYNSGASGGTGNSGSSSSNSSELNLLSRIIYAESRGEPYTGQVAVGAVCLNRIKNSSFPNTLSGVIYQNGAFDAVADGQVNMQPNDTARKAAQDALNGWDPTYGAIYYFNPATATNKWIWSRPMTVTIGMHRFCK